MKFQQELLALFLQQHHAVLQQQNMQGFNPLTVAQLHDQGTLEDEAVTGELQVLVLNVDGMITAHLVQAGTVQIRLELSQPQTVLLSGNNLVNTVNDLLSFLRHSHDHIILWTVGALRVLGHFSQ